MTTWFSASAVVPQLRSLWNLSDTSAAWLTIAVQLGFVAGALLSSTFNVADLLPLTRIILVSCLGAAAVNAGLLVAGSAATAIPLRFATGFFLAGVYPPVFKLMATWTVAARGTALGIMAGAIAVGSATPHLVNAAGGLDYQTVVVTTSLLTVLGGAIAFRLVGEGPFPFPVSVFDPREVTRVLRNRGVRLASIGYFAHMWELFAMWAWFVAFFSAKLGADGTSRSWAAPLATFSVIAAGGIGCWIGGLLGDRWGRTKTTILSLGVSGTCALTIGLLFDSPAWLVLVVGLAWGLSVIADSAQFSTMVTELADQAYVGTALTLQLALGFTLTVATIWLIPILEGAWTWRWAFAILAAGPAVGIVSMLKLKSLPEARLIAQGRG